MWSPFAPFGGVFCGVGASRRHPPYFNLLYFLMQPDKGSTDEVQVASFTSLFLVSHLPSFFAALHKDD
jgi:hypothetical protein